jgi:hypothetical protein
MTLKGVVEDTFNLLGHAARKLLGLAPAELAKEVDAPALVASSIKRGLDIDWNDPEQKAEAIGKLVAQLDRLEAWVRDKLGQAAELPPLSEQLATLARLRAQDLEPDPEGGRLRIRDGVAEDRQVSIEDPEMRHGRKSKSRTFNGYKSHLAADVDTDLVLACGITPANAPETNALPSIIVDVAHYTERNQIGELHIDRGYVAGNNVQALAAKEVPIVAKPWHPRSGALFSKSDVVLGGAAWALLLRVVVDLFALGEHSNGQTGCAIMKTSASGSCSSNSSINSRTFMVWPRLASHLSPRAERVLARATERAPGVPSPCRAALTPWSLSRLGGPSLAVEVGRSARPKRSDCGCAGGRSGPGRMPRRSARTRCPSDVVVGRVARLCAARWPCGRRFGGRAHPGTGASGRRRFRARRAGGRTWAASGARRAGE